MAFNDLFRMYPNRNLELRSVAKQVYEFGKTIAQEPSAAHSNGLDPHALGRQRSYVEHAMKMVESLNAKPVPDNPASHPTEFPVDLTQQYNFFTSDVAGNAVPLNEATQLLAEKWMITAVELVRSQSAAIAGSLVEFDYERAKNNLEVMAKLLDEIEARPFLDLPETAEPGSGYGARGSSSAAASR